jgi:hypothetical protein
VLLQALNGGATSAMSGIEIGRDAHDPLHVHARLDDRLLSRLVD